MTPAGVGNLPPGDPKTAVSDSLKEFEPTKLISQHSPRRQGNHPAKSQQARLTWLIFIVAPFSKARSLNDGKPDQRHLRPDFTRQISIATSRCRNPTSARLFETLRRPELLDSTLSKQGLPLLPETNFGKACGALCSWKTLNRSKPKNEPESDKIGGMFREASYLHSHFHIFASLPGLNGSATNRHRVRIYW